MLQGVQLHQRLRLPQRDLRLRQQLQGLRLSVPVRQHYPKVLGGGLVVVAFITILVILAIPVAYILRRKSLPFLPHR